MKATLIILTMLASALAASAQQPVTATTEDGRKYYSIPRAHGACCAGLPHKSIIPSLNRGFRTTSTNSYKIARSVQVRRVFDSGAESDIAVGYS